jgi:hypothetical protein
LRLLSATPLCAAVARRTTPEPLPDNLRPIRR